MYIQKFFRIVLVGILLQTSAVYADDVCEKSVTFIKIGNPAPCSGYLFSPEMEEKMRILDQKSKILELSLSKQEELTKVQDERIILLQDRNLTLYNQLEDRKETEWWKVAGAFVLGSIITGFIASQAAGAVR